MGKAIWTLVDKILAAGQSINDRLFGVMPDHTFKAEPFMWPSSYYDDQPFLREMYLEWLISKNPISEYE